MLDNSYCWLFLSGTATKPWSTSNKEHHHILRSCSCIARQTCSWLVDWSLKTNRKASAWFIFFYGEGGGRGGLSRTGSLPIKIKSLCWTGTINSRCLRRRYYLLLKEKYQVWVFQIPEVWSECWCLCCNLTPNGSAWNLKWCRSCSNKAFRLQDIAVLH